MSRSVSVPPHEQVRLMKPSPKWVLWLARMVALLVALALVKPAMWCWDGAARAGEMGLMGPMFCATCGTAMMAFVALFANVVAWCMD